MANFRKLFLGITAAALLSACAAPAATSSKGAGGTARAECYIVGQPVIKIVGIKSYNFYSSGDWIFNTEGGKIDTNAVCVVTE